MDNPIFVNAIFSDLCPPSVKPYLPDEVMRLRKPLLSGDIRKASAVDNLLYAWSALLSCIAAGILRACNSVCLGKDEYSEYRRPQLKSHATSDPAGVNSAVPDYILRAIRNHATPLDDHEVFDFLMRFSASYGTHVTGEESNKVCYHLSIGPDPSDFGYILSVMWQQLAGSFRLGIKEYLH